MLKGVLPGRTFLLRLALLQPIKMESSVSLANKSPTKSICFSTKFGCNTSHSVSPPSPDPLSSMMAHWGHPFPSNFLPFPIHFHFHSGHVISAHAACTHTQSSITCRPRKRGRPARAKPHQSCFPPPRRTRILSNAVQFLASGSDP